MARIRSPVTILWCQRFKLLQSYQGKHMLGPFHMRWLNADHGHSATLCVWKGDWWHFILFQPTLQEPKCLWLERTIESKQWWEGWSSMRWPHCLFPLVFKLWKQSSLTMLSWRTHESQREKRKWQKGCPVLRLELTPKYKKDLRKSTHSPLPAARCLIPRQPSQPRQHSQSHEKRFMLNITHYHKMLISVALTDGPKKQISAVWWRLLGFQ